MPEAKSTKPFFTFTRGIITEANPLTYPEQASIDEANFVLNNDGSRYRRLGMDYETSYTLSSTISESYFSDLATSSHVWTNVGNDGDLIFTVAQTGQTVHFYDGTKASVSDNKKSFTIDLNTYKAPNAVNIGGNPIDVASANGKLFIVSQDIEPIYVEYNSTTDSITVTQITIQIRDFEGLDDGLAIDERPTTLSTEHNYNLLNQGWLAANITSTFTSKSEYPSNADIQHLGKDSNDDYSADQMYKNFFGNTPASQGHYILDAFSKDRNTASGLTGITTVVEDGRPSTVAFMAGRVFYAGIDSNVTSGETNGGNLYYSQVLEGAGKEGLCYQSADPSAEDINDLLATDGGIIRIPDSGTIKKIIRISNSIVVFSSNGVWEVSGNGEDGFSATSQEVNNISEVGVASASSVIHVEGSVFFWSDGGIYIASPSEVTGRLNATNITENTIQSLYNEISPVSKEYAVSSYDKASKQVSWLFNGDSTYDGESYRYKFNKELIFDLTLKAFYVHTISSLDTLSPYVAGYFSTPALFQTTVDHDVLANGVSVEANAVQVVVPLPNPARGGISTKYLTVVPQSGGTNSKITYSQYNNTGFMDWYTNDSTGVTYLSYLITGYDLFGDLMRVKQAPYLSMHFNRTEDGYSVLTGQTMQYDNPSSCLVQIRWDWSDSTASGKWGTAFQAYKLHRLYVPNNAADTFDYGHAVVTTKNKVRGSGKALSIYMYSEEGKDMQLLGWGMKVHGRSSV